MEDLSFVDLVSSLKASIIGRERTRGPQGWKQLSWDGSFEKYFGGRIHTAFDIRMAFPLPRQRHSTTRVQYVNGIREIQIKTL